MKACVTGGAGFIGSHLVDRLVADGHHVVVIDDLSTGRVENLGGVRDRITVYEADIRDSEVLQQACADRDVVFHLAAVGSVPRSIADPLGVTAVNLNGTINVLEAARHGAVRRVLFASSSSVYGANEELPKREDAELRPVSPYAASKCAAEAYVAAYGVAFGFETAAFRFFNVFGPRQRLDTQYGAVVPRFVDAMQRGIAPIIHGDGSQTRDFTYVSDVVNALMLAAQAERVPFSAFNLGGGVQTSVTELAAIIGSLTSFDGSPQFEDPRAGDVRHSLASCTRIEEWVGWKAHVPVAEGLQRMLDHEGSAATT